MIKLNFLFVLFLMVGACSDDDDNKSIPDETVDPPTASGVIYFRSSVNFQNSYSNLKTALRDNENISVVQELNHSQNAASVNMDLAPTQIIFFGNPRLGTPLMQEDQLAGLDLPQRVLFYEEESEVFALYNSTDYLASRYEVADVESLPNIAEALNNLVSNAVNAEAKKNGSQEVELHDGIVSINSSLNFETTYNNLKSSIESNENLSIVAELDHQENAASVEIDLRPTKVIMFGNPNLGTPLMQSTRSIALDLPQKMLVWEGEDGTVTISYNSPEYLKKRHQMEGNQEQIEQISNALEMLANSAAGIEN
ncbi:DUF302 domain-containing protein [Autumnicola psychrophila]|uniref:DUF302 domain-containing protein n=1 Tax=Autumnicola psychrophila TaxID=3075592 RepID=A0ABU3DRZ8_9FLAO|nr:DUF302 domain-containing protein [Zunongwangia sp. F225]MDT0686482.1 DUF302 domain-containing protein [Zunongwangia sp. F225]